MTDWRKRQKLRGLPKAQLVTEVLDLLAAAEDRRKEIQVANRRSDLAERELAEARTFEQKLSARLADLTAPVPMLLWCPACGERHVDGEQFPKIHHTHACQFCGLVWRPAIVPTVGVVFLPGFKDEVKP